MPPAKSLSDIAIKICDQQGLQYKGKVGGGTFKETFHAIKSDGISIALKLYRPEAVNIRAEREINAMIRCDHPNIAKLYEVNALASNGYTYIYLYEEFLSGGTLTNKITNGNYLNRKEVLLFGKQLISAIGHIAKLDLVHRDLKPDNILYRQGSGTPVITDFGIVRDLRAETLTDSWQTSGPGTPGFAAPEQLNNIKEMIDWRSDQFSCGIILSICSLQLHPYSEINEGLERIVLRMANYDEPTQIFQKAVSDIRLPALKKMVEPWPVNRYRTISDLVFAWEAQGE